MTAELRRGIILAGVGLVGGFALVVAIFGTGTLMKRTTSVPTPGDAPHTDAAKTDTAKTDTAKTDTAKTDAAEPLAGKPGEPAPTPADKGATPPAGAEAPDKADMPAKAAGKPDARAGAPQVPSLDIVRVEPSGEAVIAGRGAPNATVEILRDDRPIARATADPTGQFAIVPPALPTGSSEITFRTIGPDGKATKGKESIVVVVAEKRDAKPLVAVSTPDKPTLVLSQPEAPPATASADAQKGPGGETAAARIAAKPDAPAGADRQRMAALPQAGAQRGAPRREAAGEAAPVKIVSVDAQEGGRLDVTGRATAWATLRLYLNDTLVASGQAGPDGRIAFTIGRGVAAGGYQIRVDQVDPGTGKVAHRAQVAFAFPASPTARVAGREPTLPQSSARAQGTPPPPIPGKPEPAAATPPGAPPGAPPAAPAAEAQASSKAADDRAATAAAELPRPQPGEAVAKRPDAAAPTPESDRRAAVALAPALPEAAVKATAQPLAPPSGTAAPRPAPEIPAVAAAGRTDAAKPTPETDRRTAAALAPALPPAAAPSVSPPEATAPRDMAVGRAPPAMPGAQPPGASAALAPRLGPTDRPGAVFVPEISTAKIIRGDNLWQISRRTYGSGMRYTVIYDANQDQIRDPDLIYPGQIFVLPKDEQAPGGQSAKRG